MKLCGILLIIAAGLGLGLSYTRRLQRLVDELCRAERLLDVLCDRLTYSAQPLATLWQTLASDRSISTYPLVKNTSAELCKGVPFYTAFSRTVDALTDSGRLTATAATLLKELGGALGHSGLDEQIQLIRHCAERLKKEQQTAEQHALARARVYPMMGLAGGVSLAFLLL